MSNESNCIQDPCQRRCGRAPIQGMKDVLQNAGLEAKNKVHRFLNYFYKTIRVHFHLKTCWDFSNYSFLAKIERSAF